MNSDLSAPASPSPVPDAERPADAELASGTERAADAEPASPPESTPAAEPASSSESTAEADLVVPQVRFKGEGGRLLLLLPSEMETANSSTSWTELWVQLKHRLNSAERFWQPNTPVHLIVRDRLLDVRQLQDIADALTEAQLHLKRVYTSRRQTAVAAATAGFSVEQQAPIAHLNNQPEIIGQAMAEPLYVHTTLRSGVEIRHPGSVIVLGDVNPGSSIVADGDVLVWGVLRGVAQAGASGNSRCMIMALRMEPTQIRIADYVARSPETPPAQYHPEVAYVTTGGIRIAKAAEFSRDRLLP